MSAKFQILEAVADHRPQHPPHPGKTLSELFGTNSFGDAAMQKYLHPEDYAEVKELQTNGKRLTGRLADRVAEGMKRWALERGATHYAHWFQPLTGKTAEKHDSFFCLTRRGLPVEEFGGAQLSQAEPDGSSFPGGGLRSTFEARGYTSWDPSSPAFLMDGGGSGPTLCIPSIFVAYGGQAMDFKLPLLRSCQWLSKAAVPICQLFDDEVTRVISTLGAEQEYFVVDETFFNQRSDLLLTGRTLVGKPPPRGQQLEDHYFGSIPERVLAFQQEFELESIKLGIPLRTRHNEVAPGQYETAPQFEETNVASDHNQLLMDLLDRIARRHHLRVLLHEKPFAGVNGSGKHHNFSVGTNTGTNLLSPGDNPFRNLQFLVFFICIIKAVHDFADVLRSSLAYAANDHRLGANEAPPAIISVFVGATLSKVLADFEKLNDLAQTPKVTPYSEGEVLDLIENLPALNKDNTDRNRTSPFAFTGNKFEIRAPGSSTNCAATMAVMNTILGVVLIQFKKELDAKVATGVPQRMAIREILQRYVKESKSILFEGDNYSEAWKEEAARRGLPNLANTPDALEVLGTEKAKKLFQESGVYTHEELHAFFEVKLESYAKQVEIEARTLSEIVTNQIVPAAISFQTELGNNIGALKSAGIPEESYVYQKDLLQSVTTLLVKITAEEAELQTAIAKANSFEGASDRARAFHRKVVSSMQRVREHADGLEGKLPDRLWPLVKYQELLFIR